MASIEAKQLCYSHKAYIVVFPGLHPPEAGVGMEQGVLVPGPPSPASCRAELSLLVAAQGWGEHRLLRWLRGCPKDEMCSIS